MPIHICETSRTHSRYFSILFLANVALTQCRPTLPNRAEGGSPQLVNKAEMRCGVLSTQKKPLVVDWPSSERGELEGRAREGKLVVVQYEGCKMRVLSNCRYEGASYKYRGLSVKVDREVIKSADELFAKLPVYAVEFEGKLKESKELNVKQMIVGRYQTDLDALNRQTLRGLECENATHLVTGMTVGAFEFFAGAESSGGSQLGVLGAKIGGESRGQTQMLSRDGEMKTCESASSEDKTPPSGCSSPIRIEVLPFTDSPDAKKSTAPLMSTCPPDMVAIPGGQYVLTVTKEESIIKPFCIDKTEVTVAAYTACKSCEAPATEVVCNHERSERSNHPVNCVSFEQAKTYCASQGKRLPSEAEWEWAARGGDENRMYPWGNDAPSSQLCWDGDGNDNGKGSRVSKNLGTCAVASFAKGNNRWGVSDLSGNVWEWTSGQIGNEMVVRGGSWLNSSEPYVRGAKRHSYSPEKKMMNVGFRCVR